MKTYLRSDLQNLSKIVHQQLVDLSEEIITEVLDTAMYHPGINQYVKKEWKLKLNNYMKDELPKLLKKTFLDSSIYFILENGFSVLIIDWSLKDAR